MKSPLKEEQDRIVEGIEELKRAQHPMAVGREKIPVEEYNQALDDAIAVVRKKPEKYEPPING